MDRMERLERAVLQLANAVCAVQCPCTLRERQNGHTVDCGMPEVERLAENARLLIGNDERAVAMAAKVRAHWIR